MVQSPGEFLDLGLLGCPALVGNPVNLCKAMVTNFRFSDRTGGAHPRSWATMACIKGHSTEGPPFRLWPAIDVARAAVHSLSGPDLMALALLADRYHLTHVVLTKYNDRSDLPKILREFNCFVPRHPIAPQRVWADALAHWPILGVTGLIWTPIGTPPGPDDGPDSHRDPIGLFVPPESLNHETP